ncbi:PCYCGC motif-containing (lipo)protein [Marininema halotolerans]|uniref:Lipoprotein n=1 Tax=Marininema halotolerans TaxID=1155944 RepID=A0A1I6TZY3_9BACL|nr:PCYCGC motif-containing (lipo)protein [Marininema halotolerans]SFS94786.1 Protein of unknown function with PCYCGC motif-containing protein [Marininema halotolerans]
MPKSVKLRGISWVLFSVLIGSVAVGCQNDQSMNEKQQTAHQGDIQEATASKKHLPSFLKDTDPHVRTVYRIAAEHANTLEKMPCYCGCGESVGHKNNLDCFVQQQEKNGEIIWDSHGMKCSTCLMIAKKSVELKNQGKSDLEIRKMIDQEYEGSYGNPTPTPMPQS